MLRSLTGGPELLTQPLEMLNLCFTRFAESAQGRRYGRRWHSLLSKDEGPKWGKANERRLDSAQGSRKDDSVVLVKNEECVHTSLAVSEFLSLYNTLGVGGNQASGSAVFTWLRAGKSGVFDLEGSAAALASEAFLRVAGKNRSEMAESEADGALKNVSRATLFLLCWFFGTAC